LEWLMLLIGVLMFKDLMRILMMLANVQDGKYTYKIDAKRLFLSGIKWAGISSILLYIWVAGQVTYIPWFLLTMGIISGIAALGRFASMREHGEEQSIKASDLILVTLLNTAIISGFAYLFFKL